MIRLFNVVIPTRITVLFFSELLIAAASYLLAGWLTFSEMGLQIFLFYEDGTWRLGIVLASILLGVYFQNLYTQVQVRSRLALAQQFFRVVGVALILQSLIAYLSPDYAVPRSMMMLGSMVCLAALIAWRMAYNSLPWVDFRERLLFVGADEVTGQIAEALRSGARGFTAAGCVDDGLPVGDRFHGIAVLGGARELAAIVDRVKPHRVVLGLAERREHLPLDTLLDLQLAGVSIQDAAALYESTFGRFCLRHLRPSQLIFSNALASRPGSLALQSIYTNLAALPVLLLAAPFMLCIALAIKLTSRGPVLVGEKRLGLEAVPFTLYKFRCARTEARQETRLGVWLRRHRLEALPQLINVVRGELSFVGPPPERPEFARVLADLFPYYRQRHCVKPGITGWTQIQYSRAHGLGDTMTRLEYDLYYIKNLSLALDAYILVRALKTALAGQAA